MDVCTLLTYIYRLARNSSSCSIELRFVWILARQKLVRLMKRVFESMDGASGGEFGCIWVGSLSGGGVTF